MAANGLLNLLSLKMGYLTQRSAVIADNISNANTPGFQPKDLESFDKTLAHVSGGSGGASGGLQMAVTDPSHLTGTHGGGSYKTQTEKDLYEVKPSGNAVVLEQQMNDLAQNYTDYSTVTSLYHQTIGLIKTALTHSG